MSELWNALLHGLGQLLSVFYDLVPNYGVAIVLLTIAVRTAMIPLTIKQTRSMQEMSRIQPEMQRLRAKHKGDRQKLTEETMKLYKEHGVNPYGGCLPLILQMPVFFALFQVFQRCGVAVKKGAGCPANQIGIKFLPEVSALKTAIIAEQAGFLGMSLSYTPLQAYRSFGIVSSLPYFVWVLLMAATTWYQQKQISSIQSQSGQMAAQTQMMMKIMPVMLGFFSLNFPVALTIYWVTSNLWTIGQQYLLVGRKARSEAEAGARPPGGPVRGQAALQPEGGNPGKEGEPQPAAAQSGAPAPPPGKPKGSGARKRRRRRR